MKTGGFGERGESRGEEGDDAGEEEVPKSPRLGGKGAGKGAQDVPCALRGNLGVAGGCFCDSELQEVLGTKQK